MGTIFGSPIVQSQLNYGGGFNQQSMNLNQNFDLMNMGLPQPGYPWAQPDFGSASIFGPSQTQTAFGPGFFNNFNPSLNLGGSSPWLSGGSNAMPGAEGEEDPMGGLFGEGGDNNSMLMMLIMLLCGGLGGQKPPRSQDPQEPYPPEDPTGPSDEVPPEEYCPPEDEPPADDEPPVDPDPGTGPGAVVEGDPHFSDGQGGKYDVMGIPDKTYELISGENVQANARFDAWGSPDATIIGAVGLTIGKDKKATQVQINKEGTVTVASKELKDGETSTFDSGMRDEKGRRINAKVTKTGNQIRVLTGGLDMTYTIKNDPTLGNYIDQNVKVVKDSKITGLLGDTIADPTANNGKLGKGAQGEGAIPRPVDTYGTSSLFATNSNSFFGNKKNELNAKFVAKAGQTGQTV